MTVQHAGAAQIDGGGVITAGLTGASRLNPYQTDAFILHKGVKHADGIGAAAHACHHHIRQPACTLQHLGAGLPPNDGLKLPDQCGERMGASRRTETIQGIRLMGNPVAQSLIDGILQRAGTALNRENRRSQQFHAHDVHGLAFYILCAHKNGAVHVKPGGRRSRSHAVLPRPGFRNKMRFPHHFGQKGLAEGVVDFVGSGVQQVLPFQPQAEAQFFRKVGTEREGSFTARVIDQQILKRIPVLAGRHDGVHGFLQLHERGAQRFRYEAAAEIAEISFFLHAMW